MRSLGIKGLENALNAWLQFDPETVERLLKLENKVIQIEITDWNFIFFIRISQGKLMLLTEYHEKIDTIIRGKLFQLWRVGKSQGTNKSLFENTIEISGDLDIGADIRSLLQKIEIDWEEHLSSLVGDTLAHQAIFRGKQVFAQIKQTARAFKENIQEYVFAEAGYFPAKNQVQHFYQEVGKLRDDVDRLSARIDKLINRKRTVS